MRTSQPSTQHPQRTPTDLAIQHNVYMYLFKAASFNGIPCRHSNLRATCIALKRVSCTYDGKRPIPSGCRWSFLGEFTSSWKGSLKENRCHVVNHMGGWREPFRIAEWQQGNIISFIELLLYHYHCLDLEALKIQFSEKLCNKSEVQNWLKWHPKLISG